MKVLIADDDLLIRTILTDMLGELGHTVVAARDGAEALELYGKEKPDAVLLDFLMPKMNGMDAMKAIRQQGGGTPIVMLTAISDRSVRAVEPGAEQPDAFLEKPPRLKSLEKALAKVAARA